MISPKFGPTNVTANVSTARYCGFDAGISALPGSTSIISRQPVSVPGVISGLRFRLSAAPGAGTSYTATLFKNGSATALTCTISDAATSNTDPVNSVTVAAGDNVGWEIAPTNTPGAASVYISCVFTGTNAGETTLSGGGVSSVSNSATSYAAPYGGSYDATEALVSSVCGAAGTIDQFYVELNGAPTAGKSYTITFYKNGVAQAVTTTISDLASTNSDLINSFTVAKGDLISIEVVPTGTPTARVPHWGFRFRPTIDGETPLFNRNATWTTSATRFHAMVGQGNNSSAEATVQADAPCDFTLKELYTLVAPAPGAAKGFNIRSRKNTANGNLLATINDPATTATDVSNTDAVTTGDLMCWTTAPIGIPTATTKGLIGAVAYIAPAGGTAASFRETVINFN